MRSKGFLATSFLALAYSGTVSAADNERVLGVYIFHRHGDRTAKAWAPANLTALGAKQVYASGTYYRSRYVSSNGDLHIVGMSSDVAAPAQLSVSSPEDTVLHNSATSFLQGLYPPTGTSETLANGTKVEAPLGGYQYIPVDEVSSGATSSNAENNAWLQGNSGCNNAVLSSNNYLASPEYKSTFNATKEFYQGLLPVINGTYNSSLATFKNGYGIFDLINVAEIHNASIPSSNLLNTSTLSKLFDLASTHEWNLAYNSTDAVRAISGAVLAGQILDSLQAIVDAKKGSPKFNIQFGAYGSFMSFFGLAQLPKASSDFYGITNYASSMTFELYTTSTASKPSPDDMNVRFLYSNGTATDTGLKLFPLFGQSQDVLSWNDFKTGMSKFAITDTQHWCQMCGNTSGQCASNSTNSGSDISHQSSSDDNGISKPVAGVIGAMVTLGVLLLLGALAMIFGGLRLVKKSSLDNGSRSSVEVGNVKSA